jgi:hypothetical protein
MLLWHTQVRAPLRAPIDDGGALAMEIACFRDIHNTTRLHRSLGDCTPREVYLAAV